MEKYGLKVSSLYIAQVKDELGIKERENYNIGKSDYRVPQVTDEKRKCIIEAFKHYKMRIANLVLRLQQNPELLKTLSALLNAGKQSARPSPGRALAFLRSVYGTALHKKKRKTVRQSLISKKIAKLEK